MKVLFIIDGAAGDAKRALIEIIRETSNPLLNDSKVIKKMSTRKARESDDIVNISESNYDVEKLKKMYDEYQQHVNSDEMKKYYLYRYPDTLKNIAEKEYQDFQQYYCIEKSKIDEFISVKNNFKFGFLVVRNQDIIDKIKNDYNNKVKIITTYIHTDLYYLEKRKYETEVEREIAKAKALRVYEAFCSYEPGCTGYDENLIFSSHNYGQDDDDFYTQAKKALRSQILNMLQKYEQYVNFKNEINIFVVMPFRVTNNQEYIEEDNNNFFTGVMNCLRGSSIKREIYRCDVQTDFLSHSTSESLIKCIERADIVIVDVREKLINCFYEMAYARALGKKVIALYPASECDYNVFRDKVIEGIEKDNSQEYTIFDEMCYAKTAYFINNYDEPDKFCPRLRTIVARAEENINL